MLQKGIVEEIIDKYRVRVRVPKYDKVPSAIDGTKTKDLATAIITTLPGVEISYLKGDVVLVSYENNELVNPVIIGLLYRNVDTSEQISIPRFDSSIKTLEEKVGATNNKFNTFIRYSNNNGISFTSLYDTCTISETFDGLNKYYSCESLLINNKSTILYWSILDKFGTDVTENYSIETTIRGKFFHTGITETYTTNDTLIDIPINFRGLDEIFVSFKILRTKGIDDCNIILASDIDKIGTIPGTYIGLAVTNSEEAPEYTGAFAWMSITDTSSMLLENLYSIISIQKDKITDKINGIGIFTDKDEEITENTVKINGSLDAGLEYITSNPEKPNKYGVKICILDKLPSKMYSGWLYLIADGDTPGPTPGPTPVEGGLYYIVQDDGSDDPRIQRDSDNPSTPSEPDEPVDTKALLSILGKGDSTTCYVTVNGKKYYQSTSLEINAGDSIKLTFTGANYSSTTGLEGKLYMNGLLTKETESSSYTYNWTVPSGIKYINISLACTNWGGLSYSSVSVMYKKEKIEELSISVKGNTKENCCIELDGKKITTPDIYIIPKCSVITCIAEDENPYDSQAQCWIYLNGEIAAHWITPIRYSFIVPANCNLVSINCINSGTSGSSVYITTA